MRGTHRNYCPFFGVMLLWQWWVHLMPVLRPEKSSHPPHCSHSPGDARAGQWSEPGQHLPVAMSAVTPAPKAYLQSPESYLDNEACKAFYGVTVVRRSFQFPAILYHEKKIGRMLERQVRWLPCLKIRMRPGRVLN